MKYEDVSQIISSRVGGDGFKGEFYRTFKPVYIKPPMTSLFSQLSESEESEVAKDVYMKVKGKSILVRIAGEDDFCYELVNEKFTENPFVIDEQWAVHGNTFEALHVMEYHARNVPYGDIAIHSPLELFDTKMILINEVEVLNVIEMYEAIMTVFCRLIPTDPYMDAISTKKMEFMQRTIEVIKCLQLKEFTSSVITQPVYVNRLLQGMYLCECPTVNPPVGILPCTLDPNKSSLCYGMNVPGKREIRESDWGCMVFRRSELATYGDIVDAETADIAFAIAPSRRMKKTIEKRGIEGGKTSVWAQDYSKTMGKDLYELYNIHYLRTAADALKTPVGLQVSVVKDDDSDSKQGLYAIKLNDVRIGSLVLELKGRDLVLCNTQIKERKRLTGTVVVSLRHWLQSQRVYQRAEGKMSKLAIQITDRVWVKGTWATALNLQGTKKEPKTTGSDKTKIVKAQTQKEKQVSGKKTTKAKTKTKKGKEKKLKGQATDPIVKKEVDVKEQKNDSTPKKKKWKRNQIELFDMEIADQYISLPEIEIMLRAGKLPLGFEVKDGVLRLESGKGKVVTWKTDRHQKAFSKIADILKEEGVFGDEQPKSINLESVYKKRDLKKEMRPYSRSFDLRTLVFDPLNFNELYAEISRMSALASEEKKSFAVK
jgi:hypothetical protein